MEEGQAAVRTIAPGDASPVRAIAAAAFSGYGGHYHADPRLDDEQCDEVYADWAERSCVSKDVADEVLVAELDGQIVGFVTMRFNSDDEAEVVLNGVAPPAQGRGVYRSLMIRAMDLCASRGRTRIVISTQLTNVVVQKVWTRLGFELTSAYYTFHKWFTPSPALVGDIE